MQPDLLDGIAACVPRMMKPDQALTLAINRKLVHDPAPTAQALVLKFPRLIFIARVASSCVLGFEAAPSVRADFEFINVL